MRQLLLLLALTLGWSGFAQSPTWTDKLQMNGDFRFRHEYTSKAKYLDTAERHQERFRLRLGVQAEVNEDIKAKVRIGGADSQSPISNNTTMTSNADKKGLFIDIAAIEWKFCDQAVMNLGKQENVFRVLGPSQLLYDSDYTPEGLSIVNRMASFPAYVSVGAFSIQERTTTSTTTTAEPDSWLKVAMLGYKKENPQGLGFHVAIGYHEFSNVHNKAALAPGFLGNSNSGAKYLNDYSVGEILAELRWTRNALAYTAYVDATNNFTIGKNNQGLQVGAQAQTLNEKAKADWTFGYAYITSGKDMTVSAVNNSDSATGIDGGISHMFQIGKILGPNVSGNLTYYHAKVDNSGLPYWTEKGLADLVFNF